MTTGRDPQKFTAEEVIKRLTQSVNRIMFYVDQDKPVPADAIEFVRFTQQRINECYKG